MNAFIMKFVTERIKESFELIQRRLQRKIVAQTANGLVSFQDCSKGQLL